MSGAGAGAPDGPDRREAPPPSPPARLKLRPDFVRASGGGRVHSKSLSLQIYRRKGSDTPVCGPRVGLTVTKKVGNAVERNRVKRRLREALRAPGLPAQPDHDYVVVARREALSTPFPALVGELRRGFGDAASGRVKAGRPRGAAGAGPRRGRGTGGPGPSKPRTPADPSIPPAAPSA